MLDEQATGSSNDPTADTEPTPVPKTKPRTTRPRKANANDSITEEQTSNPIQNQPQVELTDQVRIQKPKGQQSKSQSKPKGQSKGESQPKSKPKPKTQSSVKNPAKLSQEQMVSAAPEPRITENAAVPDTTQAASSTTHSIRRRSSRTATAPPANLEDDNKRSTQALETKADEDPIGQALTALGKSRGAVHSTRHTSGSGGQEEALDSLAQAIASTPDHPEIGDLDEDAQVRRRRRRRGGRKRHRDSDDEATNSEEEESEDGSAGSNQPEEQLVDTDTEEAAKHRRRQRRRQGEDVETSTDEDAEVVVKVREPRSIKTKPTNVAGIDGSTRVEAKKQRRREGRAASRRRAPILSEAEFLARREQVERQMLIRQHDEYSQIAVIEDNILVEHYVDRASAASLIGNIYLGKVQNVLPGMEAAFIDIGRGRNAVLYAGEVDWDSFGEAGQERKIENVFNPGQLVIVQVSKDPVGAKGARLTSHVSIPGRYIVYAPKGHISGISRKLSEIERTRLKSILDSLMTQTESVVIRTAAEGASEDELVHDIKRLKAQWEVVEKKASGKQTPLLLYAEPDLTMRIVRDLFTEDFSALIVDGNGGTEDAFDTVQAYVNHVAPHLSDRIQHWDRSQAGDLFAQYRIDEQIAKASDRKVYLPSGGSLVIDRTEAMTVIDVNTGKFTGSGGNLEATVTSNNLEAAEEIIRQLRLRDIGGIIIIDFIDMVLPANRELLMRRLVECLGRDRTRHQVSEVTSLGLVQLTRKKVGTGLAEAFTKVCDVCRGQGHIRFGEPVDTQGPADGGERQARRAHRKN